MQVGNMQDINNMNLKEFYSLLDYLKTKNDKQSGKAVPLKQSQKDMIKKAKEKKK